MLPPNYPKYVDNSYIFPKKFRNGLTVSLVSNDNGNIIALREYIDKSSTHYENMGLLTTVLALWK